MDILQAVILGFVQGLGEFLPISSSAHLVIVPWFFGWGDQGLGFDVALHIGSLSAVVLYFRKDVWLVVKGFFASLNPKTRDFADNLYQRLSWLLLLAVIPGVVFGKLLEDAASSSFRTPLLIACTMTLFGALLWFVDRVNPEEKNLTRLTWGDALIIGISQALALVPGVSRSGATITAGRALSMKRTDAARFSFLLSIPITFGAGVAKAADFQQGASIIELLVGCLVAAVVGFFCIKFLLRLVAKTDFRIFIWYRVAFSLLILIVYFIR